MGLDPWRNAADVYWSKVGEVAEDSPSESMKLGLMCEPGMIAWAAEQLGKKIRAGGSASRPEFHLVSHPDGVVQPCGNPVEIKIVWCGNAGEWGDAGSADLPPAVIVQCQTHMLCRDRHQCPVAALLPWRGRVMFHVERDNEVANYIGIICRNYWEQHIEPRIPPDGNPPRTDILKRIKREPGGPGIIIDDGLVETYETMKGAYQLAADAKDVAHDALIAALGDSEWGETPSGRRVSYLTQSRRGLDTERIKAAGLYEQYCRITEFRKLKV